MLWPWVDRRETEFGTAILGQRFILDAITRHYVKAFLTPPTHRV